MSVGRGKIHPGVLMGWGMKEIQRHLMGGEIKITPPYFTKSSHPLSINNGPLIYHIRAN